MKYLFVVVFALLIAGIPAQATASVDRDAPRMTHMIKAGNLDITVTYRAIRWSGDGIVENLRAEADAEEARRRINEAAARDPLGSFVNKQDLLLAGSPVAEGIHDLWLSLDEEFRWHLVISPKSAADGRPVDVPMVAPGTGQIAPRLQIGLLPADSADGGELRVRCGRYDASLAISYAGRTTAALDELRRFIGTQAIDKERSGWKTSLPRPPQLKFDEADTYYWNLATNVGPIVIKLLPQVAPMHVSSTIYLSELGFYDGLTFHRVISGFMAQGGCPLGTGTGGPGYQYDGEFDPDVVHDRPGILSMANAGPRTDGSQFFITFVPTPHLDGRHTIFGEVVQGMETVRKLEARGSPRGRPSAPLIIERAVITVQ